MVLELFQNAVLILALCFVHRFFVVRWPQGGLISQAVSGSLFGLAAIIAMMSALELEPGLIFDARTVVISLSAMFGGPVIGGIASLFAVIYRVVLGGAGALVGVLSIGTALAVGLAFRDWFQDKLARLSPLDLTLLALAVHLPVLGWFALLPTDYIQQILLRLALPYLLFLTLATVATGFVFREIEKMRTFDSILDESEARFKSLFNSASVALLEEDVSRLWKRLEALRTEGVVNLRDHLRSHPKLTREMAAEVQVTNANLAAQTLFGVSSERQLKQNINAFFGANANQVFVDEVLAIWHQAKVFSARVEFRALDGSPIQAVISFPVPRNLHQARRVPVSILDVTELEHFQLQLEDERRRLDEILWGTDVGTWEWHVQSGETYFNERWAEMVGYTRKELEPISIKTWEQLAHPDDLQHSNVLLERIFRHETDFYECDVRMLHKDGHWVWVQDRGRVVEWDEDSKPLRMSGTHMDISARKGAEQRLERLSSVRETLLQCTRIILEERRELPLFERLVETLASNRGYPLVWVGVPVQDSQKQIKPIVTAGEQSAYLDGLQVNWSDDRYGRGPTGRAVRSGCTQVTHDMQHDESVEPWSERARQHGLHASVAAPVLVYGEVVAVINIYSHQANSFDATELALIEEFVGSLTLALEAQRSVAEQVKLQGQVRQAAFGTVHAVAATVEQRDPYTSGHQDNVARIAVAIARKLGWDEWRIEGLRLGATIHDIGKIHIPAEILNRPGRLTDPEFAMIKSHPQVGHDILKESTFPWPLAEMIIQHHERLDGSGYPNRLKGDQIIEEARILAVADVLDAMTSHRPYRPGLGVDKALEELERGQGSIYDPVMVDICIKLVRDEGFRWS